MQRRFAQVDVFGAAPTLGNPVAVVLDAAGLSEAAMAGLARWTNVSETTFVGPPSDPEADYEVRILTPGGELDFAGHPTLGTCHAWLAAGGRPAAPDVVVQQSRAGLVPVRADRPLAFAAPPTVRTDPEPAELAAVLGALGIDHGAVLRAALLDNGTAWLTLQLSDAAAVLALDPDHAALRSLPMVGVGGATGGDDPMLEVRAFAASVGIAEDPVTGSLQASAAQWLMDEGQVPARYAAAQGRCIGRDGRVVVERVGEQVWVGGATDTVIEGTIER